jgi:hypothetical protein
MRGYPITGDCLTMQEPCVEFFHEVINDYIEGRR